MTFNVTTIKPPYRKGPDGVYYDEIYAAYLLRTGFRVDGKYYPDDYMIGRMNDYLRRTEYREDSTS
jgi:hypothetical protein